MACVGSRHESPVANGRISSRRSIDDDLSAPALLTPPLTARGPPNTHTTPPPHAASTTPSSASPQLVYRAISAAEEYIDVTQAHPSSTAVIDLRESPHFRRRSLARVHSLAGRASPAARQQHAHVEASPRQSPLPPPASADRLALAATPPLAHRFASPVGVGFSPGALAGKRSSLVERAESRDQSPAPHQSQTPLLFAAAAAAAAPSFKQEWDLCLPPAASFSPAAFSSRGWSGQDKSASRTSGDSSSYGLPPPPRLCGQPFFNGYDRPASFDGGERALPPHPSPRRASGALFSLLNGGAAQMPPPRPASRTQTAPDWPELHATEALQRRIESAIDEHETTGQTHQQEELPPHADALSESAPPTLPLFGSFQALVRSQAPMHEDALSATSSRNSAASIPAAAAAAGPVLCLPPAPDSYAVDAARRHARAVAARAAATHAMQTMLPEPSSLNAVVTKPPPTVALRASPSPADQEKATAPGCFVPTLPLLYTSPARSGTGAPRWSDDEEDAPEERIRGNAFDKFQPPAPTALPPSLALFEPKLPFSDATPSQPTTIVAGAAESNRVDLAADPSTSCILSPDHFASVRLPIAWSSPRSSARQLSIHVPPSSQLRPPMPSSQPLHVRRAIAIGGGGGGGGNAAASASTQWCDSPLSLDSGARCFCHSDSFGVRRLGGRTAFGFNLCESGGCSSDGLSASSSGMASSIGGRSACDSGDSLTRRLAALQTQPTPSSRGSASHTAAALTNGWQEEEHDEEAAMNAADHQLDAAPDARTHLDSPTLLAHALSSTLLLSPPLVDSSKVDWSQLLLPSAPSFAARTSEVPE